MALLEHSFSSVGCQSKSSTPFNLSRQTSRIRKERKKKGGESKREVRAGIYREMSSDRGLDSFELKVQRGKMHRCKLIGFEASIRSVEDLVASVNARVWWSKRNLERIHIESLSITTLNHEYTRFTEQTGWSLGTYL